MPLPPVDFPTLGWQIIDWMEAFLCHGPGDLQGRPSEIDDEIALHLCWLYRVWPQGHQLAGRRIAHRGVLSRPKGRAKSEIAGKVVCAEALGPVRCDGFDANGDPVGIPVFNPFIRCLATEENQAGNTYDNVYTMLTEGEAANAYALDVGLTRTFIREPGGGEIRPSSSGSASKDGGKESCAIADETHLYVSRELREMYRVVARNTGKRKAAEPLMYDTTTAYAPGERSVAEQAADKYAGMAPEEAVTKHGVLFDHREGATPKRFGDNRSLIKAMREGYGPAAAWMDFHRIVRIIRDAEDPEAEAYRYFLNKARRPAQHWLSPDEIRAVLGPVDVEEGEQIAVGFDGSESDDHTALVGCTAAGDLFPIGIWTPRPGDEHWRTEVNDVVDWTFETFDVVGFYGDPPWFQEEMGRWAERHGSPPITEFWTNQDAKMAVACGALRTAIRQRTCRIAPRPLRTEDTPRDEEMRKLLAGKPLFQWHFENARTKKVRLKLEDQAEEAHIVRKERPGSPLKIDGVVSSILARRARDDALKAGEFKPKKFARASW